MSTELQIFQNPGNLKNPFSVSLLTGFYTDTKNFDIRLEQRLHRSTLWSRAQTVIYCFVPDYLCKL